MSRKPQGSICTMGSKMLTSRARIMGPFQGENLYTVFLGRTLAAQPTTLLVGVVHLSTLSCSDFLAHRAQNRKLGTDPMTSRTQMPAKLSPRTRKHRSPRRIRIGINHRRNWNHTIQHRTHEWMASVVRKFSSLDDRAFNDLTVFLCVVTPRP